MVTGATAWRKCRAADREFPFQPLLLMGKGVQALAVGWSGKVSRFRERSGSRLLRHRGELFKNTWSLG